MAHCHRVPGARDRLLRRARVVLNANAYHDDDRGEWQAPRLVRALGLRPRPAFVLSEVGSRVAWRVRSSPVSNLRVTVARAFVLSEVGRNGVARKHFAC